MKPVIITIDLESVLIPELWIEVAEHTGIEEMRVTTRDVDDFDKLMRMRLEALSEHNITIDDMEAIIEEVEPLNGAVEFLNLLREKFMVLVLSDTFYEFARPILNKLGDPTILCHSFVLGDNGAIKNYRLREIGEKRNVVKALKGIGFDVIAVGDSFNDVGMLEEADKGIFLHASEKTREKYKDFSAAENYKELQEIIF